MLISFELVEQGGVELRLHGAAVDLEAVGALDVTAVVIAAIGIPLSVSAWTDLSSYRGLSGIDSAIFALLATHLIIAARREHDDLTAWVASVAFAGFLAKVIAELAGVGSIFAGDLGGASPVPIAHLVGAAIGSIVGLVGSGVSRDSTFAEKPGSGWGGSRPTG